MKAEKTETGVYSLEGMFSAVDEARARGATCAVASVKTPEFTLDITFNFEFANPLAATPADPPLPEDPEERAREMKRRSDEIDFHSA